MTRYATLRLARKIIIGTILVIALLVVAFPLYWMVRTSISEISEMFRYPPLFLPRSFTTEHFTSLFSLTKFLTYYMNSLIVAGASSLIVITISTFGAYSLSRFKYRGRVAFLQSTLLLYMIPPVVLSLPYYSLLRSFHLLNTRFALVVAYISLSLPFSLYLLYGFYNGIPIQLEEAAMIDGASRLRALISVVIPQAFPGIITIAIFSFVLGWNDYLYAFVLVSSDTKRTLPVGVSMFFEATTIQWGLLMAACVVILVPIIAMFAFMQKHLVAGYGAGAIKG